MRIDCDVQNRFRSRLVRKRALFFSLSLWERVRERACVRQASHPPLTPPKREGKKSPPVQPTESDVHEICATPQMLKIRKNRLIFLAVLIVAAFFRIAVAHWLPNDVPEDGKTYAQIARNVLEQHVYSHETEAPYDPSLIRVPGYPLFLATIYSIFGHTNNGAD